VTEVSPVDGCCEFRNFRKFPEENFRKFIAIFAWGRARVEEWQQRKYEYTRRYRREISLCR